MGHFYFVRHGQTIWNVEGKICGATDIALTQLGHEQAIETGKKILEEKIHADEILYSPLMRAADSLHPEVVKTLKRPNSPLHAVMKAGSLCCVWLSGSIIS